MKAEHCAHLRVGDPMWTIVDPNDFTQSIEWPAGFIWTRAAPLHPRIASPRFPRTTYIPKPHRNPLVE